MKYFTLEELVDRATYQQWGKNAWTLFSPDLLYSLDGLREFFNTPITVNNWHNGGPYQYRGFRGPECAVGAKFSYHKRGMAVDFDVKGYIQRMPEESLSRIRTIHYYLKLCDWKIK
jgi:uncharacterized protein YcbK (DUF882 family)